MSQCADVAERVGVPEWGGSGSGSGSVRPGVDGMGSSLHAWHGKCCPPILYSLGYGC